MIFLAEITAMLATKFLGIGKCLGDLMYRCMTSSGNGRGTNKVRNGVAQSSFGKIDLQCTMYSKFLAALLHGMV